jgi:serine/threonine protein kinase
MVRPDGYAKVLDFRSRETGGSRGHAGNSSTNAARHRDGHVGLHVAEQASREPVDHRTDIWSLGVVLYELSTGPKPFTGESQQAIINRILSGQPSSIDTSLPPELDTILRKVLEKDRELRYQTASDFRADIRRLLRQIDSSPSGSGAQVARRFIRPRWLWPVITCLLILTVAVFAWSVWLRASAVTTD